MFRDRPPFRLHVLACAALLALAGASVPAHAYGIRTVIVSPVPGNPTASGTALLTALAAITTNSATNTYMIKVEPGVYDIGASRLQMKPWVDIEGSGIDVTTLQGSGISNVAPLSDGVVMGDSDCELRLLTVQVTGTQQLPVAVGIANTSTDRQRLYRVRVVATGGSTQIGIRNANSDVLMEELEVAVTGGTFSYGIISRGTVAGAGSTLLRSKISVLDATTNIGLLAAEIRPFQLIEGNVIAASGGAANYGAYYQSGSTVMLFRFSDNTIEANGDPEGVSYAIRSEVDVDLRVSETRLRAATTGGTSVGVYCTACTNPLRIDHTDIVSTNQVVVGGPVRIGASRLAGASATGSSVVCAAVYDGAYTYYPGPTCP
jgi:hypothetical protein